LQRIETNDRVLSLQFKPRLWNGENIELACWVECWNDCGSESRRALTTTWTLRQCPADWRHWLTIYDDLTWHTRSRRVARPLMDYPCSVRLV